MPFLPRSSRHHQDGQYLLRGVATKLLVVTGMSLAFLASVLGLEYLLGDEQNLKSTAQTIAQSVWPRLRAAGIWGLAVILLIASFFILMIKQMPGDK